MKFGVAKKLLSVVLSVCLFGSVATTAFAVDSSATVPEGGGGSIHYNKYDDNYRLYTEYMRQYVNDKGQLKGYTAGVKRKTVIYAYLNQGEKAYFGSSVYNSMLDENDELQNRETKCDIVVTDPMGNVASYDVIQNGAGHMVNHNSESVGPNGVKTSTSTISGGYDPLSFTAPYEGTYAFVFHSTTGEVANPNPVKVNGTAVQNGGTLSFWDITVTDKNDMIIPGRTYANFLSINSGNTVDGSKKVSTTLNLFVLTNDGYKYKVNLNGIVPWGFVFFANNMGLTTTGDTPYSVYHSIFDNDADVAGIQTEEKVDLHFPFNADTDTQETFKIFFEEPNDDLMGKIYDEPAEPESINEVSFRGFKEGGAYYGQGGVFEFKTANCTSAKITIDFNPAIKSAGIEYDGSGIVELDGAVSDGYNKFKWDGKDTSGKAIPVGVYHSSDIMVVAEPKVGEVHFPLIDAEGLLGENEDKLGLTVERLNGTGGTYSPDCDDSRYDLYYNNSPLVYGTIEGTKGKVSSDGYYDLTDGTRSKNMNASTYFTGLATNQISTLIKNPDYKSEKYTGDVEVAEYIHVPVNSSQTSISWKYSGSSGGGNQAIVDSWTYYANGKRISSLIQTDLQIYPVDNVGKISGRVFFENYKDKDGKYQPEKGEYPLKGFDMVLLDENGNPIYEDDEGNIVQVDEEGYIIDEDGNRRLDEEGNPIPGNEVVRTTDVNGTYDFYGVPYDSKGTTYRVKVNLSDIQKERYELTSNNDGNEGATKINKVVLKNSENKFEDVGYTINGGVEATNLTIKKKWSADSLKQEVVTVKLLSYMKNQSAQREEVVETVYLSPANGYSHTVKGLEKGRVYFIREYYTNKEGKLVLIGESQKHNLEDASDPTIYSSDNLDSGYKASFQYSSTATNQTFTITNTQKTANPKIIGATLFIENKIGINFYVYFGGKAEKQPDGRYKAVGVDTGSASWCDMYFRFKDKNGNYFTEDGGTTTDRDEAKVEIVPFSEGEINFLEVSGAVRPLYRFTHWYYAFEMADDIEAEMHYKSEKGTTIKTTNPITYSIRTYCKNMLGNSTDKELCKTLKGMLNYGAYSQLYWDKDTDNLANSILSAADRDVSKVSVSETYKVSQSSESLGIKADRMTLGFGKDASFDVKLILKANKGHALKDFTTTITSDSIVYFIKEGAQLKLPYTMNEKEFPYADMDKEYDFIVQNVPVYRWDDKFTLTFNGGGNKYDVTFCLLSYAYNVVNDGEYDESLVNLIKAMTQFNQNSLEYFKDVEQFENEHGIPNRGAGSYKR